MHLRDRAVIGILSLVLVGLAGAVVAPSFGPVGPAASLGPSLQPLHPYVEGVVGTVTSVSPFGARTQVEREIAALLFRGLVRPGPGNTLVGDLADRWEVNAGGDAWTFHLRAGLTWQDGEPITAEDVVFTVTALSDPNYSGPGAASWREVRATSSDPSTVTLTLATPLGGFLEAATQPIAPAHLLSSVAPSALPEDPFGQRPVASSSFRLAELDTTHALLLPWSPETASDGGGGPLASAPPPTDSLRTPAPTVPGGAPMPYLDGIEFMLFPDLGSLVAAWDRGELDGAAGLGADVASRLAASGGAHLLRYPATTLLAVTLNLRPSHPEFRDPAVRRALLQAIDRDGLITKALGGLAVRADAPIPPTSWAFDRAASPVIAYDPRAAAAALTAAGWKRATGGGWIPKGAKQRVTIELLSPEAVANPAAFAVADAVAADWLALGLTVTRVALPGSELVATRLQTGKFSAAVIATGIGPDPDLYPILASTQATTTGPNFSGLQDPALDQLLVKARAPGTVEARKAAYTALQAKLATGVYLLPVAFPDVVVVVRDTLTGPGIRPIGSPGDRFWDVLTWRLAAGR
jgi:peptide/nickel transport system substrate-binding protein